ncbi:hypothetical protein HAX54_025764 [Datura stramonium]|uniref:Uncharacterized protein n=1 Tax=Datura stramonium TaxID=4076 RepID=A0ABS8Y6U7_DATST|nr:hypothetical protein [Datura stramonium]
MPRAYTVHVQVDAKVAHRVVKGELILAESPGQVFEWQISVPKPPFVFVNLPLPWDDVKSSLGAEASIFTGHLNGVVSIVIISNRDVHDEIYQLIIHNFS